MYDLSVPRSVVARFSTPSSSQPAVPWPSYRARIDGDAYRKNGPNVFPSEILFVLMRYILRDALSIIPTDMCILPNKSLDPVHRVVSLIFSETSPLSLMLRVREPLSLPIF